MASFASYKVMSAQTGQVLFIGTDPVTARADCITQANQLSLDRPNEQMSVVPFHHGAGGARPLLTFDQLQALAVSVRRQPVLTNWT